MQKTWKISHVFWQPLVPLCFKLRGTASQTKLKHVLCDISKLSTLYFFWNIKSASQSKLSEELKNDTQILVGQAVWIIDQNNILHIFIDNSRSAWSTIILMHFFFFFFFNLIFQTILLQDTYITHLKISSQLYTNSKKGGQNWLIQRSFSTKKVKNDPLFVNFDPQWRASTAKVTPLLVNSDLLFGVGV